jgi:hypothetical protein
MQVDVHCFPYEPVHTPGFLRQNAGVVNDMVT